MQLDVHLFTYLFASLKISVHNLNHKYILYNSKLHVPYFRYGSLLEFPIYPICSLEAYLSFVRRRSAIPQLPAAPAPKSKQRVYRSGLQNAVLSAFLAVFAQIEDGVLSADDQSVGKAHGGRRTAIEHGLAVQIQFVGSVRAVEELRRGAFE